MKQNLREEHKAKIIEQFSQQSVPFNKLKGHYDALGTIIQMSEVGIQDRVLDLACGTAIVSCEFAKYTKEVIGLDITQEMINQGLKNQKEMSLENVFFQIGDVESLPFEDESFDIVFTRYSFHHFLNPSKVLDEMIRVCKPSGKIMVVDVALDKQYSEAYNTMEKLRDPSHVRALSFDEFEILFSNGYLKKGIRSDYRVEMELENQLAASFPNKGDEQKITEIFREDILQDSLGMNVHTKGSHIHFSYPISIFLAQKIATKS